VITTSKSAVSDATACVAEPTPQELEAHAINFARQAAALIRRQQGNPVGLRAKSTPTDVVTQTDLDAETLIRSLIARATPHAGVFGEEGGASAVGVRLQWVIDPLDGTVNFLYSIPLFSVSVAAAVDGEVVAGAVVDVTRDEVFSACAGGGARLDCQPIEVSACTDLARALVMTGFSYDAAGRAEQGRIVHAVLPRARDLRCFGSAALQLCWVAAARADAYFERDTKLWDYAAGALVAREARATVELQCPENEGLVIAATPAIFEALRALV
jgi:myo-inositol-1(or 4)-monophosphatase